MLDTNTTLDVFDPRGVVDLDTRPLAARVGALAGLRLGMLDNSKWNAKLFREFRPNSSLLPQMLGCDKTRKHRKCAVHELDSRVHPRGLPGVRASPLVGSVVEGE